jgi:hypothetical protein
MFLQSQPMGNSYDSVTIKLTNTNLPGIFAMPKTAMLSLPIENRKLYTTSGGNRSEIRVADWLVNPEHWEQLEKIIKQSR